ncbi:hypothetical protein HRG_004827 [Hirsutella rhossiliensis]|uniref:F-box domain-containing protein n=1 Tax=Hirsutella rhossiliensis TaxID=111463 RepID=A0A9P8SJP0_9HYPO|nr:uncharacterized protein HRG_04827 [Hirsutella rhossiliensis]KAH0964399.1 hypothetical protein HRG_04827 [Hirsutella rhossiliensis]
MLPLPATRAGLARLQRWQLIHRTMPDPSSHRRRASSGSIGVEEAAAEPEHHGATAETEQQQQQQQQQGGEMPACSAEKTTPPPPPPQASPPDWPMGRIPVEIFELITSYLSRAEVKSLRLVCREFEISVSAQYFRNVVVPFKAELYSYPNHRNGGPAASKPKLLLDGMRIFHSFGPHILRFALSLEVDEDLLAYPPIKTVQRAVPSFWGIYRWPHDDYRRYHDLEDIERTADETGCMREALRCLTKVRNLGLCCDAGLGFLFGPDCVARSAAVRHPVFATRDWRSEPALSGAANRSLVALGNPSHSGLDPAYSVQGPFTTVKRLTLLKMLIDAGYVGDEQVQNALRLMLNTEGTTVETIDLDGRSTPVRKLEQIYTRLLGTPDRPSTRPLIPADLTMAQREMLLELEWAHRAMIQSYVIGLIDNAALGCFTNVTTLTIAKIPSSHLHILCRDDLWGSIPSLKNVFLGVIADWRSVAVSTPGFVQDRPVSPVHAVGKAFRLLNDYIGKQPNIESIHFEWICGGELAPGFRYRNMHILPAPFFETTDFMTATTGLTDHLDQLLCLPHALHLSLKNCWAPPHVLLQTVRQMALSSLEKLELESVSLSGPPTAVRQASIAQFLRHSTLVYYGPGHVSFSDLVHNGMPGGTGLVPAPLPVAPGANDNQAFDPAQALDPAQNAQPTTEQPGLMSWPGLMEHFSPSFKPQQQQVPESNNGQASWAHLEALSKYLPNTHRLTSDQSRYRLKSLSFKSCGYAAVDLAYIKSRSLIPPNASILPNMNIIDGEELIYQMQRCGDKRLGLIIPYIHPHELVTLESTFGMVMGWENVYDERTIEDALADGIEHPGLGRFSGVIELDPGR